MKIMIIRINFDPYFNEFFNSNIFNFEKINERSKLQFINLSDTEEILRLNKEYKNKKINLVQLLANLNIYTIKNNIDYSMILFENSFLLSFVKIEKLIQDFIVSKCLIGARMSQANAKNLFFDSIRSPYLDYHLLLLNNKLLHEKNFFIKAKSVFNHSLKIGGINFNFFNFLERNLSKKSFFNFYNKEIFDEYGYFFKAQYIPYSLCTKYGILTCYNKFDKKLQKLFVINFVSKKKYFFYKKFFCYKKNNYYFKRKFFNTNKIINLFKSFIKFTNVVDSKNRISAYKDKNDDRFTK